MAMLKTRGCLFAIFLCTGTPAVAFCPPGDGPTVYVGDKAHNPSCTYASLNDALTDIGSNICHVNIVVTASYTAQNIVVQDKNLTISGSSQACGTPPQYCADPDNCGSLPPAPTVPLQSLSATGNGGNSVFTMSGTNNITIKYLAIKNAQLGSGTHGGGINFDGQGSLTLGTDTLMDNHAEYGGAISFKGSSGAATLNIGDHTLIESNSAYSDGGGINIEANATLNFSGRESIIASNHAGRYGGGIEVFGDAQANVSSPGLGALAAIYDNNAAEGGGVAVNADGGSASDSTKLTIYTSDPLRPVGIASNTASNQGGGVYLKSFTNISVGSNSLFCAYDFNLTDNFAPDGSAIYGTDDFNVAVGLNRAVDAFYSNNCLDTRPSDGVACDSRARCNNVSGNASMDSSGNATGSAIAFHYFGAFNASRVAFNHNFGQHFLFNNRMDTVMDDCLMTDNETSLELVSTDEQDGSGSLAIYNCTITNNTVHSIYQFDIASPFKLHDSIIFAPLNPILNYSGDSSKIHTDFSLVSDANDMVGSTLLVGEPHFMDADNEDYRLYAACFSSAPNASCPSNKLVASRGIDAAPNEDGLQFDVAGRVRNRDVPQILGPDPTWTRDIGAFEMQQITDRIFADGYGDPILFVY